MEEKVYFSKVEFRKYVDHLLSSVVLINLVEGTLSYQEYKTGIKTSKVLTKYKTLEFEDKAMDFYIGEPGVIVKDSKTNFKPVLLADDEVDSEVTFSYGHKLSKDEMDELLPLCNALDFEPYRDGKMIKDTDWFFGYRDEMQLEFTGITDSYIPVINIQMDFVYDETWGWPCESLYRHILFSYLTNIPRSKNSYKNKRRKH